MPRQEKPVAEGEVVGWIRVREGLAREPVRGLQPVTRPWGCAADTAKSLGEAITIIRMNNQPAK